MMSLRSGPGQLERYVKFVFVQLSAREIRRAGPCEVTTDDCGLFAEKSRQCVDAVEVPELFPQSVNTRLFFFGSRFSHGSAQ
jgi:hypothetical protein